MRALKVRGRHKECFFSQTRAGPFWKRIAGRIIAHLIFSVSLYTYLAIDT